MLSERSSSNTLMLSDFFRSVLKIPVLPSHLISYSILKLYFMKKKTAVRCDKSTPAWLQLLQEFPVKDLKLIVSVTLERLTLDSRK